MAKFWGGGKFPYTNINNLNLDWMIKLVLELRDQVAALAGELGDVYIKPDTGIPKSDLSAGVQASLNKADTALQSVPDTYRTAAAQDVIDGVLDDKINPLYTPLSLSGAQVSFNTEASVIPEKFIVHVLPVQSGAGAPSPSNPRALSARSDISITHNNDSITIPMLSAAPTYGGDLDMLTGIYTEYGAVVNLSELYWSRSSSNGFFYAGVTGRAINASETFLYCTSYEYIGAGSTTWITNNLQNGQIAAQGTTTVVRIRDERFSTVEDFLAANASTQIVFRSAKPTVHKIPVPYISAVSGANTYSTTAGMFSMIVNRYLAALDISARRAAPAAMLADVESAAVSRAYSINDFLIYNNQLCKVTAPIQSGGTIQIGVNAVITTLGAEITALLNS